VLQGNERHPDFDYPDAEWEYFILADRFGWTPTEVDAQPARLVQMLISIGNAVEEVKSNAH
jgi:hypothetical protein